MFIKKYNQMQRNDFRGVRRMWLGLLNVVFAMATSVSLRPDGQVAGAAKRTAESDIYYRRASRLCSEKIALGNGMSLDAGSRAYLEKLLEGEPTFQFKSVNNMARTVQRFRDKSEFEYVVFKDIPSDTFERLVDNESSVLYHCPKLYIHDTKSLRITMTTTAHGVGAGEFASCLTAKLIKLRVDDDVTSRHTALRRVVNVSKEPDGSWGPWRPEPCTTCILEVGMSESENKLLLDSRIWLELPESPRCRVHQVITIKIHEREPRIILQKWEQSRREWGKTRSNHPRQAIKTQEVQVSLVDDVPVATGSLRLSLSKLLERTASEGDIVFTPEDLTKIARKIWAEQPNIIPLEKVL